MQRLHFENENLRDLLRSLRARIKNEIEPIYTLHMDGNAWLATRSDFVDLQESLSGFGATPVEALNDLIMNEIMAEL